MNPDAWRVRLGEPARADYRSILAWTGRRFGVGQIAVYPATIEAAIAALRTGPLAPGSVPHEDYGSGMRTLHIARNGRRGSHVLVYRVAEQGTIEIARILHDAMDVAANLAQDEEW